MKISMEVKDTAEVLAEVKRLAMEVPGAVGAALYEEGLAIEAASKAMVPVDTGRLRATGYTAPPIDGGQGPEVEVGYGTDYAVPVHERLNARHSVGEAKYLEKPLQAAASGFATRVAARTRAHMERGTPFATLPATRDTHTGSRGGKFYYSGSGRKVYVKRKK